MPRTLTAAAAAVAITLGALLGLTADPTTSSAITIAVLTLTSLTVAATGMVVLAVAALETVRPARWPLVWAGSYATALVGAGTLPVALLTGSPTGLRTASVILLSSLAGPALAAGISRWRWPRRPGRPDPVDAAADQARQAMWAPPPALPLPCTCQACGQAAVSAVELLRAAGEDTMPLPPQAAARLQAMATTADADATIRISRAGGDRDDV